VAAPQAKRSRADISPAKAMQAASYALHTASSSAVKDLKRLESSNQELRKKLEQARAQVEQKELQLADVQAQQMQQMQELEARLHEAEQKVSHSLLHDVCPVSLRSPS
jgi:hypothetical protein